MVIFLHILKRAKEALLMTKKKKEKAEFEGGNVKDVRLDAKKSLPEASAFTEPDQNKKLDFIQKRQI